MTMPELHKLSSTSPGRWGSASVSNKQLLDDLQSEEFMTRAWEVPRDRQNVWIAVRHKQPELILLAFGLSVKD